MMKIALSSERGFTLIEALIVVALVAILAALAAPSFTTLIANQRVASAAQDLQALILFARAEAILKRTESSVTATGLNWEVRAADRVLREATLSEAVSVEASLFNGVVFETSGQARFSSGDVVFTVFISAANASRAQCLSVTRAGLVRLKGLNAHQPCP